MSMRGICVVVVLGWFGCDGTEPLPQVILPDATRPQVTDTSSGEGSGDATGASEGDERDDVADDSRPDTTVTPDTAEADVAPDTTLATDTTLAPDVAPDTAIVPDTVEPDAAPDTTLAVDTTDTLDTTEPDVAPDTTVAVDTTVAPDTAVAVDTAEPDVAPDTTLAVDTAEPDVAPDTTVAADTAPDTAVDTTEPDVAPDTTVVADTAVDTADPPDTAPPEDTAPIVDTVVADTTPDVTEEVDTGPPPPPPLAINEYDCHDEWFELVATSFDVVNLDGLYITDTLDDPTHFQPLFGSIPPGYFVDLPLNFGVSCGLEGLMIVRAGVVVVDAPAFDTPGGFSYGRFTDVVGDFTITAPTPGGPNVLPDYEPTDPGSAIYDPFLPVATINITLPQSSIDAINADPCGTSNSGCARVWAPGTFSFTEAGAAAPVVPEQPVSVRLKGRLGSFRELDQKAAFKLDFNRDWPGASFRGLESMTLNNMVQDDSRIHEVIAYDIFAQMNVPAPRTAYAWVKVNGADYGFYLNLEAVDKVWRKQHYPSTLAMYEGEYGDDFFTGKAGDFDFDGGDEVLGLPVLTNFINRVNAAPAVGFMANLDDIVDWDEVLAMMATEVFIGHWDGYAPTRNNYFVHFDDDGIMRMSPWGTDQTFGDRRALYDGRGLLLSKCVADPACRYAYEDKLILLAGIVRLTGYLNWANPIATYIQPFINAEPRDGGGNALNLLNEAWTFLIARRDLVDSTLDCARDPNADRDNDGYVCEGDCSEGDPTVHVGAVEICDDGIDQDCSGRADDGPNCSCARTTFNNKYYWFCEQTLTYAEAVNVCNGKGAKLVKIDNKAENDFVKNTLIPSTINSGWIGANDGVTEGAFLWPDGTAVPGNGAASGFEDWKDNEPNNYGGNEDCAECDPGGSDTWNDVSCTARLPALCEAP